MSFVDEDDIYALGEGLIKSLFKEVLGTDLKTPFPHIPFNEAMDKYGSDKPDLRFDLPMVNVGAVVSKAQFKVFGDVLSGGGVVKAINAKGCADFSRKDLEELTAFAGKYGAKGMAWFKVKDGKLDSNIAKYFPPEVQTELLKALKGEEGDLFLFGADSVETVNESLGALRVRSRAARASSRRGPSVLLLGGGYPHVREGREGEDLLHEPSLHFPERSGREAARQRPHEGPVQGL